MARRHIVGGIRYGNGTCALNDDHAYMYQNTSCVACTCTCTCTCNVALYQAPLILYSMYHHQM